MSAQATLKTGWWCFALPGYRDHPRSSTYSLFSYEALPPLEVPTGTAFHWLQSERVHEEWSLADNGYPNGSKPDLGKLPDFIAQAELSLPSAFSTFMQSLSLHQRIRSCTACYLDLGDYVVRTSSPANGVLIHFLSDQQWCLHWYLYADQSGEHCVTVSGEAYGFDFDPSEPRVDEIDLVHEDIRLCAPTFNEFIYRFWLENEIWFTLARDKTALTAQQSAYINHYRSSTT